MAIDTSTPRSRRTVLGAGLGALAAVVATALGRPGAVEAATGEPLLLGAANTADATTSVTTTADRAAIQGHSDTDIGLAGDSKSYVGVFGTSDEGTGVRGVSGRLSGYAAGVYGEAVTPGGVGAFGNNHATSGNAVGAQGTSHSPAGLALVGWADAGGLAVVGFSGGTFPPTPVKTGVHGRADQDGTSVGVSGSSAAGRGGVFAGKLAQLRLAPSTRNASDVGPGRRLLRRQERPPLVLQGRHHLEAAGLTERGAFARGEFQEPKGRRRAARLRR